jgi:hypothetical protein
LIVFGALALTIPVGAQSKRSVEELSQPVFTLITPRPGQAVAGGSRVTVAWNLEVDKTISENPWAEMELFLLDDNGLNLRITPQLSVDAKTFEWTVPRVNSRSARIMLQVGIEGEGDFYNLTQVGSFFIRSKAGATIMLNSLANNVKAGENLDISWTTEMMDSSRGFDVMISYNRGAHYFKAGTTTENRFSLPIDEDFSGSVTVMIVGRGTDGSKVSSLISPDATVRIRERSN